MELKDALRKLLLSRGSQVLDDIRLANMLADFKAYEEQPAVRYLIKTCLSEGLMQDIINIYNEGETATAKLDALSNNLNKTFGFRRDIATFFTESLKGAFGWQYDLSPINIPEESNKLSLESNSDEDDDGHLKFMRLPINGKANSYMQKLVNKGLVLAQPYSNIEHNGVLTGPFAGFNNCTIVVGGSSVSDTAWRVIVVLPTSQSWYTLKGQYEDYKEKLTKKYGAPKSYEFFQDPYYEGDGDELTALFAKKCTWSSFFQIEEGFVVIEICDANCVRIIYEDKINSDLQEKEVNDIASDDL